MRAGAIVMGLVVSVASVLAGCGGADEPVDPPRRLGHEIVVTGSVERTLDTTGFVLASEAHAAGLLVVAPGRPVAGADVVEVMGIVRRFERRAVEREVGRPLDLGRYGDFEGEEYVDAERITVRP